MDVNVLPIRVRPYDEESFYGYLLRLASANGRKSVGELLKLIGVKDKPCHLLSEVKAAEDVSNALSPWIMYPSPRLFERFHNTITEPHIWDAQRSIQVIRVHSPRFCPECFKSKDKRYFRAHWALLPNTHCTEHRVELIDHCPQCSTPLEWRKSVFSHCLHCGVCWASLITQSEPIPDWQLAFNQATHEVDHGSNWLRSFCHKVIRAARPFDLMHGQIQRLPDPTIDIRGLVEQAWNISTCNTFPLDGAREWPPEGFVKARRLQLIDSIHYHVTLDGLAQALSVPKSQVSYVVAYQLISAIHDSSVIRDMIFDVRDAHQVVKHIPKITVTGTSDNDIKITPTTRILKLYGVQYGQIIARGVTDGMLKRPSYTQGLVEAYIPHHYLLQTLGSLMADCLAGELIPISRTKQILAVSGDDVKDLIESGDLHLGRHSSTANRINGDSMLELIATNHPKLSKRNKLIQSLLKR